MKNSNNLNLDSSQKVRDYLHTALSNISDFQNCALLDYPSYNNIGDHLIWLGSVFYITRIRKAKIDYACTKDNYVKSNLTHLSKKVPILLNGGGNFGDLWPAFQRFRERVIQENPDRPIVILPQTIHYTSKANLNKSAEIINKHPNLTIFARDNNSFVIAKSTFTNCQVYKAPDIAFEMIGMPQTGLNPPQSGQILYLCRNDKEMDYRFKPDKLGIDNLHVDDWVAFSWINKLPSNWIRIPGLVRLVREGWQRGLQTPSEWLSRQYWQWSHPYADFFGNSSYSTWHRTSWGQMHSGIYQLQKYDLIITNRLHVHILCLILNLPHILLPGSYSKISDYYKAWTSQISISRFVEDVSEIPDAINYLHHQSIDPVKLTHA